MNAPPRLRDDPRTQALAHLLEQGLDGADRAWPASEQTAVLQAIAARLEPQRTRQSFWSGPAMLPAALAAAVAFFVFALVNWNRATAGHTLSLGDEGELTLARDASVELPPLSSAASPGALGRRVVLRAGQVCAKIHHRDLQAQGPLWVEAPKLRVTVVGTQFCVTTDGTESSVKVTEGRVRAEGSSGSTGSVMVGAGESVRSDDRRLAAVGAPGLAMAPPQLLPAPAIPNPTTAACAQAQSFDDRRSCETRVSSGDDLAAENALFGLALLERDEAHDSPAALKAFRDYSARFPHGVFAPEALRGEVGELLAEKRYPEALAFLEAHPLALGHGDEESELLRAQILGGPLARPAEALPILRKLSDASPPAVREEALYALGESLLALAQPSAAAAAFARSLAEFPNGAHAAELRSLQRR